MKALVYICGAYKADTFSEIYKNICEAGKVALEFANKGYSVFCPHTNFSFVSESNRAAVLKMCLEILERCDMLVALPSWVNSDGSKEEIERADNLNIPIFWYGKDEL